MTKGKLLVFEGIDGSGKTTQVRLLLNYLKSRKIAWAHYSFPRYDKPWGKMVRRYLDGEFGKIDEVNPYLASILYAGDRFAAAGEIRQALAVGKIVVCDRYTGSNLAHQSAKLITHLSRAKLRDYSLVPSEVEGSLITFTNWVEKFEYQENRIPREDLVILLSMPSKISQRLMKAKKKDIHEADREYLAKVSDVYDQLARDKANWVKIDSAKSGKLRKPVEIFREVLTILKKHSVIR